MIVSRMSQKVACRNKRLLFWLPTSLVINYSIAIHFNFGFRVSPPQNRGRTSLFVPQAPRTLSAEQFSPSRLQVCSIKSVATLQSKSTTRKDEDNDDDSEIRKQSRIHKHRDNCCKSLSVRLTIKQQRDNKIASYTVR